MEEETIITAKEHSCKKQTHGGSGVIGGGYGLAFIGAAVYYIQNSTTFWGGVLGVLKAIVWPAILVYKLLDFLR
ncbi:hypothetical protein D4R52_00995 [bacterium]|nr:MAG: hypothetical protein D4R52_00995 [bacterium]